MPNINFLIFCKTSVYFRTKEGRKKNTVRTKSFISIIREFLNSFFSPASKLWNHPGGFFYFLLSLATQLGSLPYTHDLRKSDARKSAYVTEDVRKRFLLFLFLSPPPFHHGGARTKKNLPVWVKENGSRNAFFCFRRDFVSWKLKVTLYSKERAE